MRFSFERMRNTPNTKTVGIVTILAAFLCIIVILLMRPVENELMSSTAFGVMELEFAWTPEQIETIFSAWGESLIEKELGVTLIDMVFLIVYSVTLAGATLLLSRSVFVEPVKTWGFYITFVPVLAAIFDFIENVNLILMLSSPNAFPEFSPFLASISAMSKFGLLGLAIIFWIVGFIHYLVKRIF
jgi:hypothetical protein